MTARTPGPWMPSPLKASERKGRNIVLASDYAMMKLAFEDQVARLTRERDEATTRCARYEAIHRLSTERLEAILRDECAVNAHLRHRVESIATRCARLEEALRGLVLAASSREGTMGDPIDLLVAKDDVRRALAIARAALRGE